MPDLCCNLSSRHLESTISNLLYFLLMKKYLPILYGVLAFVLPLGLYLKTLSPTYIPVDSAEFTLCMHYWGMCHPPGFPFYVFLGKIFTTVFPWGQLIYKANLLSALYAAGTILVLFITLVKVRVSYPVALLISFMLAVSAAFWEYSISADVFSFATFLVALSFLFVFIKKPFPAFLALGFSASHFYITVMLAPLFAWYFSSFTKDSEVKQSSGTNLISLVWNFRWLGFKFGDLVVWASFFALGFVGQVMMFLRMQQDPVINWGHAKGIAGYLYYIRRMEFGSIFLIANPVLTFSLIKYFKHIYVYLLDLVVGFGVVLPILVPLGLVKEGLWKDKKVILLVSSWLVIVLVQLFLLSTIDPTGADNPFQINKFYLVSYIPILILIGMATQKFASWFFDGDTMYVNLLLGAIVAVYLLSNFKSHNLSMNYFSQNMVLDAMDQLPPGSVAITVSHLYYFGGLYEQKVDGKYRDVSLLYFPNEFNRDNESYHPELFSGKVDEGFVAKVRGSNQIGNAEKYILSVIARNPGRDIYILQGTFEEGFFKYLDPYKVPYGLWWRVVRDPKEQPDVNKLMGLLGGLRNGSVKYDDLLFKQQQMDTMLYAVSYNSTGIFLARNGEYGKALDLFNRSYAIKPDNPNVKSEIDLVGKIKDLSSREIDLVSRKDADSLNDLGNSLFSLGNYNDCARVYADALKIDQRAAFYNNMASCQAAAGNFSEARTNYEKALSIDPNLNLAKQGLDKIDSR